MDKITISLKDIERMRMEILGRYAFSSPSMMILTIEEFAGLLKRKGANLEITFEEETLNESDE